MEKGRIQIVFCISGYMNKYLYQIQGALENADRSFGGFRVFVCTNYNFGLADAPAEIFDQETIKYLEFRLKLSETFDMRKLPATVQNDIKMPLGHWLDEWVLNLIYGDTSESEDFNLGLLENGTQPKKR